MLGIAVVLCGCGTYVPNIQEYGNDTQADLLVKAIVGSIRCEIGNAVKTEINNDKLASRANGGRVYAAYLNNWAALVVLTLQVDELSALNPSVSWLPTNMFALGGVSGHFIESNTN